MIREDFVYKLVAIGYMTVGYSIKIKISNASKDKYLAATMEHGEGSKGGKWTL